MPEREFGLKLVFVVIFLSLAVGCQRGATTIGETPSNTQKLSSEAQAGARSALKALRKVASATEVGISYAQYGSLLIEAKPEVDEALLMLPEGKLKTYLNAALDAYLDAHEAWGAMIRRDRLALDSSIGKKLTDKYGIPFERNGDYVRIYESTRSIVLNDLWGHARTYLNSASAEQGKAGS